MVIERDLAPKLRQAASRWPAVTLTGPRQSGKTTLCSAVFVDHPKVSLEDPDMRAFASEDPRGFLRQWRHGAVIDEVLRVPELLSYLQGLIDADPTPGRWILTGSHDLALMESVTQSLAGRTVLLRLLPLARNEVLRFKKPPLQLDETLLTGGYPRIFDRGLDPSDWLASYIAAYIERDVRAIANVGDLVAFQRFMQLCAGRTGQLLNYSALASDSGVSQPTAKAWLSVLETSFVVFRLPAFHTNVRKRLVRMPKLHFYDTGVACWLLGIRTPEQLQFHPMRGSLFESWVASEIVKHGADPGHGLYHYRDRAGNEVDLLVERPTNLALVETKAAATPSSRMLDSPRRIRRHLAEAHPDADAYVVYGGDEMQHRSDGTVIPWHEFHQNVPTLRG